MSASLQWAPVDEGRSLHAGGSSLVEALRRAFGESPWIFDGSHVAKLEGMRDGCGDDNNDNPYSRILEALLDKDGVAHAIRVWPEY